MDGGVIIFFTRTGQDLAPGLNDSDTTFCLVAFSTFSAAAPIFVLLLFLLSAFSVSTSLTSSNFSSSSSALLHERERERKRGIARGWKSSGRVG